MASGKEFSGTSLIRAVAQLSRITQAIAESRLAISSLVSGGIGPVLAEASSALAVAVGMFLGNHAPCLFPTDLWLTLADDPNISFSKTRPIGVSKVPRQAAPR
jgi:hypothetical protein